MRVEMWVYACLIYLPCGPAHHRVSVGNEVLCQTLSFLASHNLEKKAQNIYRHILPVGVSELLLRLILEVSMLRNSTNKKHRLRVRAGEISENDDGFYEHVLKLCEMLNDINIKYVFGLRKTKSRFITF